MIIIIIIKYYFSYTLGYDGTFWESIVQLFSQQTETLMTA